ncbi:MAG TPA: hypothetical protein VIP11_20590 [Gemmatimonadaceae bacterium]
MPASIQAGNTIEDQYVANVSPELFDILGVRPAVGRKFSAADTTRDALPVVVRVVLHDAAVTVLAGTGIGAFIALAATHGFADGMFNVRYELAFALVGAESILLAVGALACLGPIRQALRANPVDILRAC